MSMRAPFGLGSKSTLQTGMDMLSAELMVEKGSSLGRAGRAVEEALATLAAIDSGEVQGLRSDQVELAASLVWELLVQQEACGVRSAAMTYREYKVPKEVIAKVGSVRPRAGPNAAGVSFLTFIR